MSFVRVKVCGITRPQDAELVVELGVDAVGMILHADSPRTISLQAATEIRRWVPAFVNLVGVFVDAPEEFLRRAYEQVGLDLLQLHGAETPAQANQLGLPYIKAVRAKSLAQVQEQIIAHSRARAILLDAYVQGQAGGTGQRVAPNLWPEENVAGAKQVSPPLILAGGLTPDNIVQAVEDFRPFAIDLNSGLESAPGEKGEHKVRSAFSALRAAGKL